MNQVKIVPIFDQTAPGVWDDFLHICATTMDCDYGYELSSDERARTLQGYENEYKHFCYNFAFGAYDNQKMVGFIRGSGVRTTATIKCLYVLPDYQKHHIGHNLLSAAERSIAPAYKNIELISLWHAENFYQRHNYTTKYGTNTYIKRVDLPHCYDVPLFGFPARIKRMCSNLFPDLDVSVFIAKNTPLFAHFDVNGNIDGVVIGVPQSNRAIISRAKDDWNQKYLTRTFNNYKQFVSALNPEHVK